jgi:hypothetical protein
MVDILPETWFTVFAAGDTEPRKEPQMGATTTNQEGATTRIQYATTTTHLEPADWSCSICGCRIDQPVRWADGRYGCVSAAHDDYADDFHRQWAPSRPALVGVLHSADGTTALRIEESVR